MQAISQGLLTIKANLLRACKTDDVPVVAWQMVCGSPAMEKTRIIKFDRGVLTVAVVDAQWVPVLEQFTDQYLLALNKIFSGQVRVRDVRGRRRPPEGWLKD